MIERNPAIRPVGDPAFVRAAIRESIRDALGLRHAVRPLADHLATAMAWLALAQDKAGNGGLSAGFGRLGWKPDYPETTGYTIPTFLDFHRLSGEAAYLERAKRMGRYELAVQTRDGAIPGGFSEPRSPCVFDTGQVIFGWTALFQATGQAEYLTAARAAGDWLISVQAGDGSWPTHDHAESARSYHSRVAWALVALGDAGRDSRYIDAARRQLDWTLANRQPNGWFRNCELRHEAHPVTHTLAYTVRGLLESGAALGEERYISAARGTADVLLTLQLPDGSVRGAFDARWAATARWRCLTGCAQLSIIWLRLSELTGDQRYLEAARRSNTFLRQTQDLGARDETRGAIKGSWPFYGRYERFSYPNWAAKFFADALMLEQKLAHG